MPFIGNVEIPIISAVSKPRETEVNEITPLDSYGRDLDNVVVKHEPSVETIILEGYLNQEIHSQGYTLDQQKKDIKNLRKNTVRDNTFNFLDYKGHLTVDNIDFNDNSDSGIVKEITVEAKYYPWPKYFPESEP